MSIRGRAAKRVVTAVSAIGAMTIAMACSPNDEAVGKAATPPDSEPEVSSEPDAAPADADANDVGCKPTAPVCTSAKVCTVQDFGTGRMGAVAAGTPDAIFFSRYLPTSEAPFEKCVLQRLPASSTCPVTIATLQGSAYALSIANDRAVWEVSNGSRRIAQGCTLPACSDVHAVSGPTSWVIAPVTNGTEVFYATEDFRIGGESRPSIRKCAFADGCASGDTILFGLTQDEARTARVMATATDVFATTSGRIYACPAAGCGGTARVMGGDASERWDLVGITPSKLVFWRTPDGSSERLLSTCPLAGCEGAPTTLLASKRDEIARAYVSGEEIHLHPMTGGLLTCSTTDCASPRKTSNSPASPSAELTFTDSYAFFPYGNSLLRITK